MLLYVSWLAASGVRRSAGRWPRTGPLLQRWFADLREQPGQVRVSLTEQVLAADLGTDSFLQELGCRQPPGLHFFVEVVRKVYLHPWHTPTTHSLAVVVDAGTPGDWAFFSQSLAGLGVTEAVSQARAAGPS